jgi:hypothetical protein
MGVKGLAPSSCLPHGGREGVTLRNFHVNLKKLEGISDEPIF